MVRVTSGKLRYASAESLTWRTAGQTAENAIVLDPSKKFQEMLGFGAAFTDAACYMFNQLPAPARDELFHELFHPSEMGLNVCRTCIGSSDYSTEVFSYDEGEPDPEMKRFSIAHDQAYVLPMLRLARKVNPDLFLFSSPWSPPGWMKVGGSMLGGSIRQRYFGPYSKYFVNFLQAYAAEGVTVQAVTVQNEVDTDQDGRMPACLFPQEYEIGFVKNHLGPLLRQSGLSTKIWILDHNYNLWGRAICELDDEEVRKYCDAVAFHGYVGTPEMMDKVHEATVLDGRWSRLHLPGLRDRLGKLGEDVHAGDAPLVPGAQRLEFGARRKRAAEHRAVSLRRDGHDSFSDEGDYAQRSVLGVCAFLAPCPARG